MKCPQCSSLETDGFDTEGGGGDQFYVEYWGCGSCEHQWKITYELQD